MTTLTYPELLAAVKKIKLEQTRVEEDEALECVVRQERLKELAEILERFFGAAFKPTGKAPSREAQNCTADFGGIFENQTLYYLKKDNAAYYAMLWPWNDGVSVTVKIFKA